MRWKIEDPRICLNFVGAIILGIGLVSSALIYDLAGSDSGGILGYEEEGGSTYPVMPDDSKEYLRGLQLYGGTANVLADDLRRWFAGLWHGESLAFTVAFITIVISAGFFYVANHSPSRPWSGPPGDNTRGKSG
jgi:hypothetical protein